MYLEPNPLYKYFKYSEVIKNQNKYQSINRNSSQKRSTKELYAPKTNLHFYISHCAADDIYFTFYNRCVKQYRYLFDIQYVRKKLFIRLSPSLRMCLAFTQAS